MPYTGPWNLQSSHELLILPSLAGQPLAPSVSGNNRQLAIQTMNPHIYHHIYPLTDKLPVLGLKSSEHSSSTEISVSVHSTANYVILVLLLARS